MGCTGSRGNYPKEKEEDVLGKSSKSVAEESSDSIWVVPEGYKPYEFVVVTFNHFKDVCNGLYKKKGDYRIEGLCENSRDNKTRSCEETGMTVGNHSVRCFGFCSPKVYVEKLSVWIDNKLLGLPKDPNDKEFQEICKKMARRIFRVWGHLFYKHASLWERSTNKENLRKEFRLLVAFCFQYQLLKTNSVDVEPLIKRVTKVLEKLKELKTKSQDPQLLAYFKKMLPYDEDLIIKYNKDRENAKGGKGGGSRSRRGSDSRIDSRIDSRADSRAQSTYEEEDDDEPTERVKGSKS